MDIYCLVPDCGIETAKSEYDPSPEALRKQPELELFCLKHYKSLMADRKARAAATKVQCRQDGCTTEGVLYPGGRWCAEHTPHTHPSVLVNPPLGLMSGRRHNMLAGAAGQVMTGFPRIGGRDITDVELPESDQPSRPEIEKNPIADLALSEVAEIPGEAILYSTTLADDDPRLNSTIKSALKTAQQYGWRTKTTVAISNDELFSILVKFRHPSGKQLTTRHEQPAGKTLGFKVGWLQYAPTGAPNKVGWRDAMVFLKGEDPLDDRPALISAMEHVMDIGGDVVRVDVTA